MPQPNHFIDSTHIKQDLNFQKLDYLTNKLDDCRKKRRGAAKAKITSEIQWGKLKVLVS